MWLFIAVGIILIAGLIILFTRTSTLFHSYYEITMRTGYIGELKPGASVLMCGIQVGNVKSVRLEPDLRHAIVKLRILDKYKIRKGSRFSLEQRGFLGEQYVAIYTGADSGEFLKDGDWVESSDIFDFLQAARLTQGMVNRIRETVAGVERVGKRAQVIFSANTIEKGRLIKDNFNQALDSGISIYSNISQLIETNSQFADRISSNVDRIEFEWRRVVDGYSQLTNEISNLTASNKNYFGLIRTNLESLKDISKGTGVQSGTNALDGLALRQKISNLFTAVDKANRFSSNLNRRGFVGALKSDK